MAKLPAQDSLPPSSFGENFSEGPDGGAVDAGASEDSQGLALPGGVKIERPDGTVIGGDPSSSPEKRKGKAKNDPERFEHWQARAMKAEAEAQQYRQYDALIRHVVSKPELVEIIESSLKGQPIVPAAHSPAALKPPKRPANYNRQEALANPESESAKYDLEYQEFLTSKVERLETQIAERDRREAERQAAMEQERARQNELRSLRKRLETEQGLSAEESLDFVKRFVVEPELEDLVAVYRGGNARRGPVNMRSTVSYRPEQDEDYRPPSPPGAGRRSASPGPISDADLFNASLFEAARRKA